MANFAVRVELHHTIVADYDVLQAAMEQKVVTGNNGQTYHMPRAEYSGSGNLTRVQVRNIARTDADTTEKVTLSS